MTLELFGWRVSSVRRPVYPYALPSDRAAITRAFVVKMVYDLPITKALIDRLESDQKLRRICGWSTSTLFRENGPFPEVLRNVPKAGSLNGCASR
jgi:hypothetical protein